MSITIAEGHSLVFWPPCACGCITAWKRIYGASGVEMIEGTDNYITAITYQCSGCGLPLLTLRGAAIEDGEQRERMSKARRWKRAGADAFWERQA